MFLGYNSTLERKKTEEAAKMDYSNEICKMCKVNAGLRHKCAPIPQEGNWDHVTEVSHINGFTHGIGGCAPHQGACKLSLNIKDGIIEEALIETIGCSGMTQSAAMASEILPGKTVIEALNTDLVCDAINVAMRNLALQIFYGRSQSAFSKGGLVVGAGLEDLKHNRSQVGTMYSTRKAGPRYLELDSGYVTKLALDENDEIIGYEYINLGTMMDALRAIWASGEKDVDYDKLFKKLTKTSERYSEGKRFIDPRPEGKMIKLDDNDNKKADETVDTNLAPTFEGYDLRIKRVLETLKNHGIESLEEAMAICKKHNVVEEIMKVLVKQSDVFDNAKWAYICGTAIALKERENKEKNGEKLTAREAALFIGEALQSFCIPGSVADIREIGKRHGELAEKLLDENTRCFAFLAGHESFAAATGAINIAKRANEVRSKDVPLRVILNGLGKDAAYRISRISGFTYVGTEYNYETGEIKITNEIRFSDDDKGNVRCYGADDVNEGVAIMELEDVDVSITGNSTNPTRFQHPVAGIYKKNCVSKGKKYFSVASGGGTGRTLHPDNVAAGPASYGLTDTMGRMHSDAQFAGSSSVAAHVDMMGFIGLGNNPIVGATVACAVLAVK